MSGDMSDLKGLIGRVAGGARLSAAEAEQAFGIIMSGNATPAQMGGFLMALRVRGEEVEEIVGAARAMRAKMHGLEAPPGAIDTCGTGGDAKGTYNVSTCAAFIVAACGVPVAKHGNRALSSKSGAADVLSALGVNIDADADADRDFLRVDLERVAEHGNDLLRQQRAAGRIGAVRIQHRERVAADARREGALSGARSQPPRDAFEQHVADRVAEGIVDALEVVEVDIHEVDRGARRELAA